MNILWWYIIKYIEMYHVIHFNAAGFPKVPTLWRIHNKSAAFINYARFAKKNNTSLLLQPIGVLFAKFSHFWRNDDLAVAGRWILFEISLVVCLSWVKHLEFL